jgi:hypothetical protein
MKLDKITHDDIDGMNRDELAALTKRLLDSRNSQKQHIAEQKKRETRDHDIRIRLMPMVATLVEALADRAGLLHVPEIQKVIQSVGDQTYIQWGDNVPASIELPMDMDPADNPKGGDAEMVLNSPIHDYVTTIMDPFFMMDIPTKHHKTLVDFVEQVETLLQTAITEGFKARGITRPEPITPGTITDIFDVEMALCDMLTDADFGMNLLRTDLRASMYRGFIRNVAALTRPVRDMADQERAAHVADHPKDPDEIPF